MDETNPGTGNLVKRGEPDGDIDQADFSEFQDCATGPGIPFDPDNPPPDCNP